MELNSKKTKVMIFNEWEESRRYLPFTFEDQIKILGIVFTKQSDDMCKANWPKIVNEIQGVLAENNVRNFNLLQRVWFIKIYALSKLWFAAQVLPLTKEFADQIKRAMYRFLWAGNMFKTSFRVCCDPESKGGLGLTDPYAKCMALFTGRWMSNAIKLENNFSGEWLCTLSTVYPFQKMEELKKVKKDLEYFKKYSEIRALGVPIETECAPRAIYEFLLNRVKSVVRVERISPQVKWQSVWKLLSHAKTSPEQKSMWCFLVHDLMVTKVKLKSINRSGNDVCEKCGERDTHVHRITVCDGGDLIWPRVKRVIAKLFNVPKIP